MSEVTFSRSLSIYIIKKITYILAVDIGRRADMAVHTGELSRLPDALVNNGWVKEWNISNQSNGVKDSSIVGEKMASKKDKVLDRVELNGEMPIDPQFDQNIGYELDSPLVAGGRQDFVKFTDDNVSKKAQELASLMTEEYPPGVEFSIDGLSMESLAKLLGGIGKEIDSAFAAGELTEQEYADLNKGLDAYTKFMTEKDEKKKAAFSVMKQTAMATDAMIRRGASKKEMSDYAKNVREKWQEKISEYLKENSHDRTLLNEMIATIRAQKVTTFQVTA